MSRKVVIVPSRDGGPWLWLWFRRPNRANMSDKLLESFFFAKYSLGIHVKLFTYSIHVFSKLVCVSLEQILNTVVC